MADRDAAGTRLAKLGRYEVLSELGKGAMGIVYLAKDPVIGRMVAIKTIKASSMGDDDSESREFRERFIREAQTAGILSHPNIVTIHDIGEDPDTKISFIAMEYIEGKTLKGLLLEKAGFSWDQIADMIAQVAEAMDYAHRKGIIHRDIKPANIIVTADGKVKITDFGIAKIASSNLTTTGQFLGTPNYMSPEQVSGSPVDGRSDIFSLGVVLYELLTRRKPFSGENLTAISYKIVHEDFTPPAELSGEVPPEFNPIVARAMAKDPWNRYQRGKDFALALEQLRAHLEELRAMADLGTMVSSQSDVATAKMENLAAIAEEGARQAEASATRRPAAASESASAAADAESSASRSAAARPVAVSPPVAPPPPPAAT
ncbi:MAG TPA: serine/threonine-protein kinase, partial [Thermoanaerobaculia bacterium]